MTMPREDYSSEGGGWSSHPSGSIAKAAVQVLDKAGIWTDGGGWSSRPAGSIVGATVRVLDEVGTWTKGKTGLDGAATIQTWPNQPKALIVSMPGFVTYSNSIAEFYNTGTVFLRKTP